MATTGFWPVKNRLKEVIDYARNPDKTTNKKYLDKDSDVCQRHQLSYQKSLRIYDGY